MAFVSFLRTDKYQTWKGQRDTQVLVREQNRNEQRVLKRRVERSVIMVKYINWSIFPYTSLVYVLKLYS